MNLKKLITVAALLGSAALAAQPVSAFEGYQTTFVNPALGTTFGAGAGCISCHAGGVTSKTTLTTAFYNSYRSGLRNSALGDADSDGDGFTNKQEAIGNANDFNVATVTPFTKATGGKALANVYVIGDSQATEFAITDIYTQARLTLQQGKEVIGGTTATSGVAVDIYASPTSAAPVTLLFKAGAPDAAAMVYVIDTYAQTNTQFVTTDWAIAPNGGVQIKLLPTGVTPPARIAVVRSIPTVTPVGGGTTTFPISGGDNDGEGDDENSTSVGCLTGGSTVPMLMLFGLLGLGFFSRAKKR